LKPVETALTFRKTLRCAMQRAYPPSARSQPSRDFAADAARGAQYQCNAFLCHTHLPEAMETIFARNMIK
jgi:hypothetical protein